MRARRYQSCPHCNAGPLKTFTIPGDLVRFFNLRYSRGCTRCIQHFADERARLLGRATRKEAA